MFFHDFITPPQANLRLSFVNRQNWSTMYSLHPRLMESIFFKVNDSSCFCDIATLRRKVNEGHLERGSIYIQYLRPAGELLVLPDLKMADGSGDAFHYRNDESFATVTIGAIVEVVFIEHRREGKKDFEEVRA